MAKADIESAARCDSAAGVQVFVGDDILAVGANQQVLGTDNRVARGHDLDVRDRSTAHAHRVLPHVGARLVRVSPAQAAACIPRLLDLILNHMVQSLASRLDASFAALSDVTRRGVLEQLGRADASITDLADRFQMSLTGMKKHVGVLEQAGLVITEKVGRVRTCRIGPHRLEEAASWIEKHRRRWDARFNALDAIVEDLARKENIHGRKKRG